MLEETNASGVAQADYIYLNGRPVATLNPSTGAVYYLQDDMLGTPQLATDSSQAVAWQATYQPFGTASVSGTVTQNLRFPGQYFDSESGWNHNGFRNYIPDLGRYAEPDPLQLPVLYGYANNSPQTYSDPLGLFTTRDGIAKHRAVDIDPECGPSSGGACTLIRAALVICDCKEEACGKWKANPELRIYGDMWIYSGPFPYKGRTPIDKSVHDQPSAIAHEYNVHINPSIAAVTPLINALEQKTFNSEAECYGECGKTSSAVKALFNKTLRDTQRKENSQ